VDKVQVLVKDDGTFLRGSTAVCPAASLYVHSAGVWKPYYLKVALSQASTMPV